MSGIVLKVKGEWYESWQSIDVKTSMEYGTGLFSLLSNDFFGMEFSDWNIRMGDSCVLEIEDTKVITGYIDSITITGTEDTGYVEIKGRDKTGDLLDCSFSETANEWKLCPIIKIIKDLCSPFSIDVEIDPLITADVSMIVPTFKADEGLSVFSIIKYLCNDVGILPLSYGDGKLFLTRTSKIDYNFDTLIPGENVIRTKFVCSDVDRYSIYTVKGQGVGSENKTLKDYITPTGTMSDSGIKRYRPVTIFSDTPTDNKRAKDRAAWECHKNAGQSRKVFYDLSGWTQFDGSIWRINSLAIVFDNRFEITKTMLIEDVEYIFTEDGGEIVTLGLVDIDTYSTSPLLSPLLTTGLDRE